MNIFFNLKVTGHVGKVTGHVGIAYRRLERIFTKSHETIIDICKQIPDNKKEQQNRTERSE